MDFLICYLTVLLERIFQSKVLKNNMPRLISSVL